MTPTTFDGSNVTFAKDQPEYLPLPAHVSNYDGCVTSCWRLTWRERLKMLVTGRLWLQQLAFGHALQPQRPTADRPMLKEVG